LLAAFLAAVLTIPGNAQDAPPKIRLLTLLGRPLQISVAETRGLFRKYGISVETDNSPNSDELRAKLAAGKGDVAYAAVDNAVAMVELAKVDVIIVAGGEGSQNELIAQPDIKSIKDLRGKTLIVDAPNTAYALQMKKILLLNGLQPGNYEIKPYGVTPQRLAAMREHKEFAGSMLGPPASILARRAGLVSLGSVQELIGPYQAAGNWAQRKWAQEHRDALVKYLAAFVEAQRWLLDPANRDQVIELLVKETHLPADVAAETYIVSMTRPGGYEKDAQLDLEGFKNVLKLRAEVEGQWGGHPPAPEKYYDSSYYNAAIAQRKGAE
jgi:ABC-type nitrate/sulfonate/bicarbonate transport system substrate-binding protein